jgi:DNA-directed RNA polymerase subunit RPC12/RpoP
MLRAMVALFSARCPNCRSIEFRSVGVRNFIENALHWILKPYRCALCGRHFYLIRRNALVADAA